MTPGVQIVLSGALTFGVPMVIAMRELIVLRRRGDGPGWGGGRVDDPVPPPAPAGGLSAGKPLPSCLIPVLGAPLEQPACREKTRILEPA